MELLAQFLHLKDEPMAVFILCILFSYKLLSGFYYKYFGKPDKRLQMLSRDIQKLIIYSEKLPAEDRLEALYDYLFMGGNGEVLKYGFSELILPNQEKWGKIYRKKQEKQPDYDPKKNFEESMRKINQGVF